MYSARITRLNPTAFIFLIDQSGSMSEKMEFNNALTTKAEVVAFVTNMLIREIIHRCRKEEGVMDYFDIAAIGYSDGNSQMLIGTKENFIKSSVLAVADCKKRTFTRERILPNGKNIVTTDELNYWVVPKAEGDTPMRSAFEQALLLTSKWCRRTINNGSYPPTIFNITDGEASDGDYESLTAVAKELKALGTKDGNVLFININISAANSNKAILFPSSKNELPLNRYADMLYDMSSVMPEEYNNMISNIKPGSKPPYRGMSFNATAADLIAMMNIGSRSINKIL